LAVALILITNRIFQIENKEEEPKKDTTKQVLEDIVEELNNEDKKNIEVENDEVQDKQDIDVGKFNSPRVFTREHDNNDLEEPVEYSDDETIEEPVFENVMDPIDIVVNEETGEIQLPEKPLEMKQEIWLSTPQEKEEEYDELRSLDMVMDNILGDDDEVAEIEEITPIEEENSLPKGKIALEDIKEIKERNRGFSVNVPEPRRNNMIQRVVKK